ncbi:hypothetical protein [Paludisphaera rhizosphaerae]|uniref:hypothetical protein n=1 Tax=Paludisphaera rhizosphaerae TaxID=2711216 RepID=UPI0013EB1C7E|nr:hypothetical protein [Paludisphaera rhizosphaerae]
MITMFTAPGRSASRLGGVPVGLFALLAWSWTSVVPALAQQPPGEPAKADAAPAGEAEEAPKPLQDPSATHRTSTRELYKDPLVEGMLDPKKFPEIRSPKSTTSQEIAQLKAMASNPIVSVDVNLITNVVNAMVGEMTSTRNLQAIRDPGAEKNTAVQTAVQVAFQNLVEPVITSRNAKNAAFQTQYNKILLQKLPPLLKHQLVARIHAMIILAETANPDALKIFLDEIKNPNQTVWVKLWALRGVTNVKLLTNRLAASQEMEAAKTISDQLLKGKEWPWWVQFRGLEALAALRQGYLTNSPRTVDMAAVAFQYLIDDKLRPEVRAEAARALGAMQITTAVPKFNFELTAYATAQLAASIVQRIADGFSENSTRAQELTAVLVGPIFQTFEGQPGVRDSGLLNNSAIANKADVQKYFDALKPVAMAAAALGNNAPAGQIPGLTADLKAKVEKYKADLAKAAPADPNLFPGGPSYNGPGEAAPRQAEAGGPRRGQ